MGNVIQLPPNGDDVDAIFTSAVCSVAVVANAAGEVAITAEGGEIADYIELLEIAASQFRGKLAE